MGARKNYGARLRVFDLGGEGDRYTLVPPASARDYQVSPGVWLALTSSTCPAGLSSTAEVRVGHNLGERIDWSELPGDVQWLAHRKWPEFTPEPNQLTAAQAGAIEHFKRKHGKEWKYELSVAWATGRDAQGVYGLLLRQVRNTLGPERLARQK